MKSGKDTPGKHELVITSFKAENFSLVEKKLVEDYIRTLPRLSVDPSPTEMSLNLMLVNCLTYLSKNGFKNFKLLDVNNPADGGQKFATFKNAVQELMEEIGAERMELGEHFKTAQKLPEEEEKMPESGARSLRSTSLKNPNFTPKKLNYTINPSVHNPQSMSKKSNVTESVLSDRYKLVPHAMDNSAATSNVSDTEAHILAKLRGHPEALDKFNCALIAKKTADKAQADAKKVYKQTVKELVLALAEDSDDEVSDFAVKRARTGEN